MFNTITMRYFPSIFLLTIMISWNANSQIQAIPGCLPELDHPRLILLAGEEKSIAQNLEKEDKWRKLHQAILPECDAIILEKPIEQVQIGRRLLGKSREALRRIFQLSYAHRMTGDRKCFIRAEEEMLAIAAFSDWNPSHFLDVAEMTMAMAIGYDWLYEYLSR